MHAPVLCFKPDHVLTILSLWTRPKIPVISSNIITRVTAIKYCMDIENQLTALFYVNGIVGTKFAHNIIFMLVEHLFCTYMNCLFIRDYRIRCLGGSSYLEFYCIIIYPCNLANEITHETKQCF